ncbi:MAG: MoaD family protein, partial [Promethearchaeota archaeon]
LALFYSQVGKHELTYEAGTVGEVLEKFLNEYGDSLEKTLVNPESKDLQQYILILVNGRNIRFLKGRKTKLNEGDVVAISPPIAGGS